ncbi:MAG: hypothetical protein ACHQ9S_20750 [Candidatus Binatia bacterium]
MADEREGNTTMKKVVIVIVALVALAAFPGLGVAQQKAQAGTQQEQQKKKSQASTQQQPPTGEKKGNEARRTPAGNGNLNSSHSNIY